MESDQPQGRFEQVISDVQSRIRETEAYLFQDFPALAPLVACHELEAYGPFFELMHRVRPQVIYVKNTKTDDGQQLFVCGFAIDGIVHAIGAVQDTATGGATLATSNQLGYWLNLSDSDDDIESDEDLGDVDEYSHGYGDGDFGFDYEKYEDLKPAEKSLVDQVVDDGRYDPWSRAEGAEILDTVFAEVADDRFSPLKNVARQRWVEVYGERFDREGTVIARTLLKAGTFDVLEMDLAAAVLDFQPEADPRAARRAASKLRSMAQESGLYDKALRAIDAQASAVLAALPVDVRDQLGFATRNDRRNELLAPYISEESERRQSMIRARVISLEAERHGRRRVQRYATVTRLLLARGLKKIEVARVLRISTSVMERVDREAPEDVALEEGDYLQRALADT